MSATIIPKQKEFPKQKESTNMSATIIPKQKEYPKTKREH